MNAEIALQAPAKINLFLHITGRRADGYHVLQSLFRTIDLFDTLVIRNRLDGKIVRPQGPADIPEEQDLVVRAARALRNYYAGLNRGYALNLGCEIELEKHIPSGAGLGGGSSDAAAVLLALNRLWDLQLSQEQLAVIALELGADVPFFLRAEDQFVEGIGEQLSPIQLPRAHYLLLFPGVACPTGPMFQASALKRDCPALSYDRIQAAAKSDFSFVAPDFINVFETVALSQHPEIAAAHAWLLNAVGNARLSGSGSALFAHVPDENCALELVRHCPWRAWSVRSVV